MTNDDPPRDPFLEESGGPYHHELRRGEMLLQGLVEIDNIHDSMSALRAMTEDDLRCIVLERLFMWQVAQRGMLSVEPWLRRPPKH